MPRGVRHKPNAETRKQVSIWSAAGLTQLRCAKLLGINDDTFRKYYLEDYNGGVDDMVKELFKTSLDVALDAEHKDSSRERQFLLKTRGGYREKQEIEHSGGLTIERVSYGNNTDTE